ncbi:MAG: hypothetical protein AAB378_03020 [Patescibacteria group bacterium]
MDDLIQNQNITEKEKKALFDFFLHLPYDIRQTVRGIISAHPEQLRNILPIIDKKREFMKNPNRQLADEILGMEKNALEQFLP